MSVGSGIVTSRRASLAGYFAGAVALGAVAMAGTLAAHATETLQLKTVVSLPNGGIINSFDISFVDTAAGVYILGDRTNKGVDVIDTATNTYLRNAGKGLFTGVVINPVTGAANNNKSGPDGVMTVPTVNGTEIWVGDGDSTLKFLSLSTGAFLGQVSTGGVFRVDEMCFDPVNNIGFVANNADTPAFITAVSAATHKILGKIPFDGVSNGTPNATNGIEQCQWNPRDGKIYVTVPEINGPGDNSVAGGVSRINPVSRQVEATFLIPHEHCAGPQGLAIGPLTGGYGQMLTGCNGAVANAGGQRPTALIDDGSVSGVFGTPIGVPFLDFQAGNDMVTFNAADNHYYLARSGNNSPANPASNPIPLKCPSNAGAVNYGGNIYVGGDTQGPSYLNGTVNAGPQALGMINALTLENGPDTVTGLANCAATGNSHGGAHSVAADSANNQIYVPIPSNAFATGMQGLCTAGGGDDAHGCIAVFTPVGSDP
jgi:hypothetical protein